MDDQLKVPHLATTYTASLGTQPIAQLQAILVYLCRGIDNKALEQRIADKQPLSEQEQCALSLTGIIKAIYTDAEQQGLVSYKPLDLSGLSSSMSDSSSL